MKKDLGAVLLIAGTAIGAGMLALPTVTSPLGLSLALLSYCVIFFVMLLSGRYFAKLILHFKQPHNFVELAQKTLGLKGQSACWILYLLLMYALLAAYISAASSMLASSFPYLSQSAFVVLLPALFILFMNLGLKKIDLINRLLMSCLIATFALLCFYLTKSLHFHFEGTSHPSYLKSALPILITSFGYHVIIPTLVSYLDKNEKRIKSALLYGSLIPLIIYILWHLLIYFNLSPHELAASQTQDIPITEMLSKIHPQMALISFLFAFFAIITSFLGVALSLFDFLKDSLPSRSFTVDKKILFSLTFLPPILYIFYFKKAFYLALDHAGIIVCLLLIIFPALMYLKINPKSKIGAIFLIAFGTAVIAADMMQKINI